MGNLAIVLFLVRVGGAVVVADALYWAYYALWFRMEGSDELRWAIRQDIILGFEFALAFVLLFAPSRLKAPMAWLLTICGAALFWILTSGSLVWWHLEQYRVRSAGLSSLSARRTRRVFSSRAANGPPLPRRQNSVQSLASSAGERVGVRGANNDTQAGKGSPGTHLTESKVPAEAVLWKALRNRALGGFKFRRQHPIGAYFANFACVECKIVVELDGESHLEREAEDEERSRFLEHEGWHVMRFWNTELYENLDGVMETIWNLCLQRAAQK